MLWDLISLTNIGTLKAHKDEIRVLSKGTNLMASGGRSMTKDSSVFVWDLRGSNPVEELEKNSDIYSLHMMPNDKEVYCGSSSNYIKHIDIESKVSTALEPPHLDTVLALTSFNNKRSYLGSLGFIRSKSFLFSARI